MLAELLPGRRDRVILATKAGMPHPDADGQPPLSRSGLRASVEGSLRRLGTDYVDLFYLHQPDRATPLAETLSTVAELVAEGKIGALGRLQLRGLADRRRRSARPTRSVRRARSSPSSCTTCWPAGSRRSTSSSPPTTGCAPWSTTRSAAACSPAGTASTPSPPRAASATPSLPRCTRERYWNKQLFDADRRSCPRIADGRGRPAGRTGAALARCTEPASGPMLLGGSKVEQLQRQHRRRGQRPAARGRRRPPATPSAPRCAARCPPTTADPTRTELADH